MRRFTNVYCWHLRREWLRVLLLALALGTFMGVLVAISKSVRPSEIQEIYEKLPPAFHALIGFEKGIQLDMGHWLAIANNHPIWLLLAVAFPFAAGLRGISGGVADGTLEPILAQPISRTTYYLALASLLFLSTIVILAGSFTGGVLVGSLADLPGDLPVRTLLRMTVSGLALALSVAGIVLLCSATVARRPTTWAISTVATMFFIRFLADVWPAAAWVAPVSIFHYHNPRSIVREGLDPISIAVLLAVAVLCTAAGLLVFRKRQLTF